MRENKKITVTELRRDERQPRKIFDEGELLALGQNMREYGQQVPVIACSGVLIDGERRWRAAQLVGIKELDAIVLDKKPTATELHILQMIIEAHKVGLTAMERSNLLHAIREEHHWTVGELSEALHMQQSTVSKSLSLQALDPAIQKQIAESGCDGEKAFIISREKDPKRQQELLEQAGSLTREQFRQRVKRDGDGERKAPQAKFLLAGGVEVSIRGRELTLGAAIESLGEAVKELKAGQKQGLDIKTAEAVLRDRARASTERKVMS